MARLIVDSSDLVVAALHGRRPAVRVELGTEAPFSRLLVSVADAETTAAQIRAAAGI